MIIQQDWKCQILIKDMSAHRVYVYVAINNICVCQCLLSLYSGLHDFEQFIPIMEYLMFLILRNIS